MEWKQEAHMDSTYIMQQCPNHSCWNTKASNCLILFQYCTFFHFRFSDLSALFFNFSIDSLPWWIISMMVVVSWTTKLHRYKYNYCQFKFCFTLPLLIVIPLYWDCMHTLVVMCLVACLQVDTGLYNYMHFFSFPFVQLSKWSPKSLALTSINQSRNAPLFRDHAVTVIYFALCLF